VKRLFDLAVVVASFPLWGPALGAVAALLRLKMGSPVFFRQPRAGLGGRVFELIKFRTMTDACDADGRFLPDAQRLPALGRWLRATSLDELPELLNVLKGQMSLVGPRPLLVQYLERYSAEQARRHEVLPGITGWAQVNGRNALTWEARFQLDVWYVDHRSLWLDLRILLRTVWKVVRREGISFPNEATMSEFMGTANAGPSPALPASCPLPGELDSRAQP
jgi:lipopolysaccharide/colanic/teichoic acid biosynthesis glycosyltransferase